ncbi:dephospho-CoA kinase [Companilactobacillus mishanensis]|uniref:Dephospho-CoA kinase n=1 Tax=Companilactobacillus mishanensis TaxID=2486008 RepID=A0ABW9P5G7_9LACO|nr:dephospho-CoA kinase [Companilactobacillus mishanensis]MQS44490.1 dephospho-CoA kinase [Companilactobacillus mishanensis]
MSKIYGLTGSIATGKSTVLEILKSRGCVVYDADQVAREIVEPGTPGLEQIAEHFGDRILNSDGSLNRAKLGKIVFNNSDELQALTQITGPIIRKNIVQTIEKVRNSSDKKIYFFEIQLLFEANYQDYFNATITVYVKPPQQLQRLMERNSLDEQAARAKINSQMSIDEKKARADYLIDNSGDLESLNNEIDKLLKQL